MTLLADAGLTFLRPWWLLGLPLALLAFWLHARQGVDHAWARAVDPQLMAAMARRGCVGTGGQARPLAALFVALASALALAGPAFERTGSNELRNLDAVVLVADLSHRDASDADMTNLRFALRRLAQSTGTRQVALLVYAGDAYVASALTSDPDVTGASIAALEADTVPDPGAAPQRALAQALGLLQGSGRSQAVINADVVLVSAGSVTMETSARQAAQALAQAGYNLHTLYLAASPPQADAPQRQAGLARLAGLGGGIALSAQTPEALLAHLQQQPVLRWRAGALAGLAFQDAGRFILALAALAGLSLFRRRLA